VVSIPICELPVHRLCIVCLQPLNLLQSQDRFFHLSLDLSGVYSCSREFKQGRRGASRKREKFEKSGGKHATWRNFYSPEPQQTQFTYMIVISVALSVLTSPKCRNDDAWGPLKTLLPTCDPLPTPDTQGREGGEGTPPLPRHICEFSTKCVLVADLSLQQ